MVAGIVTRTLEIPFISIEPKTKFASTTSSTRVPFAVKYIDDGVVAKKLIEKVNVRTTPLPYISLGKPSENTVASG